MSDFFADCFGDNLISGGAVDITSYTISYTDGLATRTSRVKRFKGRKSTQPLSPDEANTLGFSDYGTNEFYTIVTTTKIVMPQGSGKTLILRFNNKDYSVRKVLPFVWNEDTPMQQGYYEVYVSRFSEKVNPN